MGLTKLMKLQIKFTSESDLKKLETTFPDKRSYLKKFWHNHIYNSIVSMVTGKLSTIEKKDFSSQFKMNIQLTWN